MIPQALEGITWIKVEKQTFDLVGVRQLPDVRRRE